MPKKLVYALRGLLIAIPTVFVLSSVIANCGSGSDSCSGDVGVDSQVACTDYSNANGCETATFENGVCNVENCLNCEVIVDDGDPVIDVDDSGF